MCTQPQHQAQAMSIQFDASGAHNSHQAQLTCTSSLNAHVPSQEQNWRSTTPIARGKSRLTRISKHAKMRSVRKKLMTVEHPKKSGFTSVYTRQHGILSRIRALQNFEYNPFLRGNGEKHIPRPDGTRFDKTKSRQTRKTTKKSTTTQEDRHKKVQKTERRRGRTQHTCRFVCAFVSFNANALPYD